MTAIIIASGSAFVVGINLGLLIGAVWKGIFANSDLGLAEDQGCGE